MGVFVYCGAGRVAFIGCPFAHQNAIASWQLLGGAVALGAGQAESAAPSTRGIAGAVYVSCTGRGGPQFGGPSAELQIIRRALGDVPLVGFFAGGEIARNHLYGYTGVLTVFTASI